MKRKTFRRQEITMIRAEINAIETKSQTKQKQKQPQTNKQTNTPKQENRSMSPEAASLKELTKLISQSSV